MNIKKYITVAALLAGGVWGTATAQVVYVEDEDKDVVVKDDNGDEETIEVPEAMMQDLDSLLNSYHVQTYLKQDEDCNMRDVNPYFEPDVYRERLRRLPTLMEMPYNEVVQKFIERYATKLRRSVSLMLGANNFYMPIFEQALETYGMPLELKYLPVIESALNPRAVSRVGATGLWQFMLATGKQYGLKVNTLVDERRDPEKASYAAAHYLRDLYRIFGDWNLVIAAYNAGPESINRAIHRAGGVKDYWKIYPYLPKETRGYVPAFIAANYIMNYYCEHNICPMVTTLPVKTDTVMVTRDVHLEQVAKVLDIDMDGLCAINPQYRHNIVPGSAEPSPIRLPVAYVNMFIDREDSIYAYRADELLQKRTEVEVADVVMSTRRESVSYKRSKGRSSRRSRGGRGSKSVTIKSGQTLSEIARKNHTTVAKLKKLNKISGTNIRAGKKLRVR
ncbi:transglycosylase SLT domain-containing protein [Prevotella sp. PINT]|jgi:Soluble lytic murein transglycosylase and related regulatory proteins (some contain LysM/invasin domains)|uniref:lytic transglycosylase domain-containing protein n=1 Tax=Palleniella intestinalis TaxID=2736291 RepID=UPI001552A669|nr:lytic transglycosylase domain-containing protein [Palleniella intestinalis]NPD80743.1 transglycosylase SLT domain-containing protein [Palleniella intestinalis]